MVAKTLPFWIQHPGRVMSPFSAQVATRRSASFAPVMRGPVTGALAPSGHGGGPLVEWCDAQTVAAYEEAWGTLAARALEPNVFLEPGFAMPAVRQFPPSQRPVFILVWGGTAGAEPARLIGLCALRPRQSAYGLPLSVAWTHEQATLNAPLLDRDHAPEALDALLGFLANQSGEWSGLLLQGVASDGALMRHLLRQGRHVLVERRSRAVLLPQHVPAGASKRHLKELRRQRRRLADTGAFAARSFRTPEEVRTATEWFLFLEARGWKGGRGTALLKDAGLAAFTRAMTRQLAKSGLCRIDTLELDGRPVAMGIVLHSGNRSYFWKTTYDEDLRKLSPGKQLADVIRDIQLADTSIALTDSCATSDHPMISHIWRDRMIVTDVIVAPVSVALSRMERAAKRVNGIRKWRGALKAAYQMLARSGAARWGRVVG